MNIPPTTSTCVNHAVGFRFRISDVVSEQYGQITKGLDLRASQRDGRSSLTVDGPFANGTLRLNAGLNLAEQIPQMTATFDLADVELDPIAKVFAPDHPVFARVSANGTASALWKDQILTFRAALTPNLTNIRADGIQVGDLTTNIACDGTFDPNRKQPLVGTVNIKTASQGVELDAVARRFGRGSAEGSVGLNARADIPLATLADLQTYDAEVTVRSSPLACEGIMVRPFSLIARLQNGNVDVTLAEATLAVANAAHRSTECLVSQLQLADTLQVQTRFESSVPVARLREPAAWLASVVVDVRGLAIARERISDFTTSCQLASGELDPVALQHPLARHYL